MDILFLGSSLFLSQIVGCLMIFMGLYVITTQKAVEEAPPPHAPSREASAEEKLLTAGAIEGQGAVRLNV